MPSALTFSPPGDTTDLHLHSVPPPPPLAPGQLLLKTLAAPINQIDLLVLNDRYPVKPKSSVDALPIPGYDAVFQVLRSADPAFTPGDHVIPREHGFGTWRTDTVAPATAVLRIPTISDPRFGALLKMGATPAYLLLDDLAHLEAGDWIVQNGATSVVAQFVTQFARLRRVRTLSVVRDRPAPALAAAKARLAALGADLVLAESELHAGAPALAGKRFALALDCVFGASGERIARLLAPGGTYANFGLLAGPGAALAITPDLIFFSAVTFRPFRLSKALAARTDAQVDALFARFAEWFEEGKLVLPGLDVVRWVDGEEGLEERLRAAVGRAQSTAVGGRKAVFLFS